jgi:ketosteroid isomerase-like protein
MSQENAASLRENIDAFDRRDRAAFLSARDPACEVIPDRNWPESGAIRGREAVWEFYVSVAEAFGMDSSDAEIIDAGGDKVVVHRETQAWGRTSGVEVVFDWSTVVTFREGKIVREQWFADRSAALEAAGLSE